MFARSYARRSRALGDPDDPSIVAHQLDACDRWATTVGVTLKPEERISEVGSGENIEGRPRFAALLHELEVNPPGAGYLFVSELSRLSRADMEEFGRILRILRTAGIKLVVAGRVYDLSHPDDSHMLGFLAVNATSENNRYRYRVALKMEQLTREGELTTGSAPFGYRWTKGRGRERGRLEPDPQEFAIVRELFADALHLSITRLSQKYHLPRATIAYMIRNPVYTGYPHRHTAWRKRENGKTSSRMLPENRWGVRAEKPGNYPAAVSLEQFYRVQEALARRWRDRAKTGEADGWCRRLLVLEEWPGARVQLSSFDHDHTPAYTFLHSVTGSRRSYPRQPIHDAAAEKVIAALASPAILRAALEQEEARRSETTGDRDRLVQELERQRNLLVQLKLDSAGSDPEDRLALATAQERTRAEIRALQTQLGRMSQGAGRSHFLAVLGPLAGRMEAQARENWENATPHEKAMLAEELLERIVVRIDCPGKRRPCQREILRVEYAAWYEPFASVCEL